METLQHATKVAKNTPIVPVPGSVARTKQKMVRAERKMAKGGKEELSCTAVGQARKSRSGDKEGQICQWNSVESSMVMATYHKSENDGNEDDGNYFMTL